MNKIIYAFLTILVFASCASQYNIQGSSNISTLDGRKLYLKVLKDNDFKNIDSCDVVHGQFQFNGTFDTVRMANIFMEDESVMPLVIETGDITIKIDNTQQTVSGTPLNDELFKFFNKYNQLKNQEAELVHTHDRPGVFFMVTIGNPYPELTPWIEDIMSKATDKFKNDAYVKDYYKKAQENQAIMNGMKTPDMPPAPAGAPGMAPQMPQSVPEGPTPNEMAKPTE